MLPELTWGLLATVVVIAAVVFLILRAVKR